MQNQEYNGWTNRETWLVHLWLTNDENTLEVAKTYASMGTNNLKAWVDESITSDEGSLLQDLASTALSNVNWQEVTDIINGQS